MPLPLAPILPLVLRLGALAAVAVSARRMIRHRAVVGRTDQRVEDAFDELGEGLSLHQPQDRATNGVSQTNSAARIVRVIHIAGRRIEVDAAFMARVRVRKGA